MKIDVRAPLKEVHREVALEPKEEWIAVPVPDSGVSRKWVDAARDAIKDNRRLPSAKRRF